MGIQFRMGSASASLVVIGGSNGSWLTMLEQVGWHCQSCNDLRTAQELIDGVGSCIGIVDLSQDDFSLGAITALVNNNKHVRWLAFIRQPQLNSDVVCQFIVNLCVDFFTVPIPDAQLLNIIGHQLGMLKLELKIWPNMGKEADLAILGETSSIKRLRNQIRRVALSDVSILISGESGVGKKRVAKVVHDSSSRSKGPFLALDCSGFSEIRLEQELFDLDLDDYQSSQLFQVNGGTLFLANIEALSMKQQQNLLYFLQQNKVKTAQGEIELDIRIIATSHIDLEQSVIKGHFKDELYYRLNVLRINVPSLKQRRSDIPILANHFLQHYAKEYNTRARMFSAEAIQVMLHHNWPGNLHELISKIKRAVLLADGITVEFDHLDLPPCFDVKRSLRIIRENSERDALLTVLESNDGQVSAAAKELGISRATMYRLLNKYNVILDTKINSYE